MAAALLLQVYGLFYSFLMNFIPARLYPPPYRSTKLRSATDPLTFSTAGTFAALKKLKSSQENMEEMFPMMFFFLLTFLIPVIYVRTGF